MGFKEAFLYRKFMIFYVRKLSYLFFIKNEKQTSKISINNNNSSENEFDIFGANLFKK